MKFIDTIEPVGLKVPLIRAYFLARKQRNHWSRHVQPGHFYSPIPSDEDIEGWGRVRNSSEPFNCTNSQLNFIASLSQYFSEIPFTAKPIQGLRYYYENHYFSYTDAIALHLIIRHFKPRRIVEVGSGFSSAVMIDTVEKFLPGKTDITFIDPYPERLRSLIPNCDVLEKQVQEVDIKVFEALESNDILFIDSSHVSKAGSDVNFLVFEVFPRIKPGVWIHVHDIFPDFDYPQKWLNEGIAWNEAYLLRAFLLFNDSFKIVFHCPSCVNNNSTWFAEHLPQCLLDPGAGLWMTRVI